MEEEDVFLLTVKIDPRMKFALKRVADKQFISASAAAKQAIEKYLEEHGIDWRKENMEDAPEKRKRRF